MRYRGLRGFRGGLQLLWGHESIVCIVGLDGGGSIRCGEYTDSGSAGARSVAAANRGFLRSSRGF